VTTPSDTSWDSLPEKAQIKATQALQRAAKKQLIEEGFLVSATQSLQNKIRTIASEAGCKVEFVKPTAP
jgi:dihydroorotase-like cyclic amidohydrolase